MRKDYWHISLTLESSTKEKLRALAAREKRSMGNYVSILIERDIKGQEASHEQEAR